MRNFRNVYNFAYPEPRECSVPFNSILYHPCAFRSILLGTGILGICAIVNQITSPKIINGNWINTSSVLASARAPKQKQKSYRKFGDAAKESHQKTATSTLLILLFLLLSSLLLALCSAKSFASVPNILDTTVYCLFYFFTLDTRTQGPYVGAHSRFDRLETIENLNTNSLADLQTPRHCDCTKYSYCWPQRSVGADLSLSRERKNMVTANRTI